MIDRIKDIVLKASALMVDAGFTTEAKGDDVANIVTSSDVAVQEYLCRELKGILPESGFICEEEDAHDPDSGYVWVIDPIDGTANYARGMEYCAISVALRRDGETVLGVVYSPWKREMYWAERGKGAFLNGKPINVSKRTFKEGILCAALCTYHKEHSQACADILLEAFQQCNDFRRFGSAAMELCSLAKGFSDLYFEMILQPWDYAAAILIIEEAGGIVTNLSDAHPSYNGPDLICGANNPENHASLLAIIRKHIHVRPY